METTINLTNTIIILSTTSEYTLPGATHIGEHGNQGDIYTLPKDQAESTFLSCINQLNDHLSNHGADDDCDDYIPDFIDQIIQLAAQQDLINFKMAIGSIIILLNQPDPQNPDHTYWDIIDCSLPSINDTQAVQTMYTCYREEAKILYKHHKHQL